MHALKTRIDRVLGMLIAAVFAVLVACVVWQVVSRYVLGTPSTVTDEMARFLFMWVGLVGAAYTLGPRRHLAIDVLPLMLSGRNAQLLAALVMLLIAGFAAIGDIIVRQQNLRGVQIVRGETVFPGADQTHSSR